MKILFRVDGGEVADISTGHIFRSLRIADYFSDSHTQFLFCCLSNREFELGRSLISARGYRMATGTAFYLREQAKRFEPDVVFIDRYNYDGDEVEFFHQIARNCIFTFDDASHKISDRHCQINALMHHTGLECNLSNLMLPIPKLKHRRYSEELKIFVCFGGYDPFGMMQRVLTVLMRLQQCLKVKAVTANPITDFQQTKNHESGSSIEKFVNPTNFDEILSDCNFAITSGGLTFFQCLSEQLITLAVAQYSHQDKTLRSLQKSNAFNYIGLAKNISDKSLSLEITAFIANKQAQYNYLNNVRKLEIGHGFSRIEAMIRRV